MLKGLVVAASSAVLSVASVSPAFADPTILHGADPRPADMPRGAVATLGLNVPMGAVRDSRPPTIGFKAGYGVSHGADGLAGRANVRMLEFADIRFGADGLERAEVATFNLADLENDRRLSIFGGEGGNGLLIVGGLVIGGLLICWAAGCFDGDDDSDLSDDVEFEPL